MTTFYMFVASPPAGTPATSIYRERQAFGPFISAGQARFSPYVEFEIAESGPAQFRNVRAFCTGQIRVLGVQQGFTPAATDPAVPLEIELEAFLEPMRRLVRICRDAAIETPSAFRYIGVSRASLAEKVASIIEAAPDFTGASLPERLDAFLSGEYPVNVQGGFVFGEVSELTNVAGYRSVGFAARTGRETFLDPVVLHRHLTADDSFETPNLSPEETTNSWLTIATKDRVLISFRDEWNAPLVSQSEVVRITGPASALTLPLTDSGGTVSVPSAWGDYTLHIDDRRLTPIGSDARGSTDPMVTASAPDHRVVSTIKPNDWFHPTDPESVHAEKQLKITEGNTVDSLVDGNEYFARLIDDFRWFDDSSFVYIQGWETKHDFALVPQQSDTTLGRLLKIASDADAQIRALLWKSPWRASSEAHKFVGELRGAQSIHDDRTHHAVNVWLAGTGASYLPSLSYLGPAGAFLAAWLLDSAISHPGSHHTKCIIIRSSRELVAHLGGIDINPNRVDDREHRKDKPYHDVQCRVTGPAVREIAKAFIDRWNDHPERLSTIESVPEAPAATGTCIVQVARTYGAGVQSYAPDGDRTIWATLSRAIRRAKRYVYIEDQYLWYATLGDELSKALTANPELRLIMVLDGSWTWWAPEIYYRGDRARHLLLAPIRKSFEDRLHVFTLKNAKHVDCKLHSKLVIIDDIFATIGSANMGQRSMTHDSELNVFVLDDVLEGTGRKFARDLRIRLWTEHLGLDRANEILPEVRDLDRAIKALLGKSDVIHGSRLAPFDFSLGSGTSLPPQFEDIADPDGSVPP